MSDITVRVVCGGDPALRYEFDLQFEVPVTYPATPFEIELPELDGKTVGPALSQ